MEPPHPSGPKAALHPIQGLLCEFPYLLPTARQEGCCQWGFFCGFKYLGFLSFFFLLLNYFLSYGPRSGILEPKGQDGSCDILSGCPSRRWGTGHLLVTCTSVHGGDGAWVQSHPSFLQCHGSALPGVSRALDRWLITGFLVSRAPQHRLVWSVGVLSSCGGL